ncbi:MAG: hypothetical protein J7K72_00235 [Candidatus Aenigmarchaeota archaeon]|nr:hypothetical protein [Candidatus Aenigmarchaeota archaeon]
MFLFSKERVKFAGGNSIHLERRWRQGKICVDVNTERNESSVNLDIPLLKSLVNEFRGVCIEVNGYGDCEKVLTDTAFALGSAFRKLYEKRKLRSFGISIVSDGSSVCSFAVSPKNPAEQSSMYVFGVSTKDFEEVVRFIESFSYGMECCARCVVILDKRTKNYSRLVFRGLYTALMDMLQTIS